MSDGSGLTRIVANPQWGLRHSQNVVQIHTNMTADERLNALEVRKANRPEQIKNQLLHAGSPMYYYCRECGHLAAIMSETHTAPVPKFCPECQSLKDLKIID